MQIIITIDTKLHVITKLLADQEYKLWISLVLTKIIFSRI